MKKKFVLLSIFASLGLILGACGSSEKTTGEKKEEKAAAAEEKPAEKKEESDKEGASGNGSIMNTYIEEETEGKAEVIYTNKKAGFVNEAPGFKVSADEYQIVKVTGIKEDSRIRFDGQDSGYVVTARMTVENKSDQVIHYNSTAAIGTTDVYSNIYSSTSDYIRDEDKISSKKEGIGKFAPGEKITGFITFDMTEEQYEMLGDVPPKFILEAGASPNEDMSGGLLKEKIFEFPYSDEEGKTAGGQADFYQDRLTMENIAEKTMILENESYNQSVTLEGVKATVLSYQYTDLKIRDAFKEQFKNFDEEMVAISLKFKVENQSKTPISLEDSNTGMAEDELSVSLESGLGPKDQPDVIQPGESAERMGVYLFNKDEFGILDQLSFKFGPLMNDKTEYLFDQKQAYVEIELPKN
ncbi:DUF5068 domain-containing protein [Bacillus mangrovi]|uniref:DUF5068 domain-containing protein n=1 Tax=Metabacillus mangrovi TaxID=1491830 RepID=A0A7X2S7Q1_9BACI|nr:DUF5068 domain-containing protein [Metabacillus mangrovi]MTH54803.1 DUF5068 domain-containing protein [Metabacillus mangrovi]